MFRQEARREELSVRGVVMGFSINVDVCETCGEVLFDEARDQRLLAEAFAEYRRQKNLLGSQEIKAIRERFALSQKSFASLLGMSEATINRYESGALQEETHDNMIRLASTPEAILGLVERRGRILSEWQRNRTIEAARSQLAELPLHRRLMPTAIGEFNGGRVFSFDRYSAAAACPGSRPIPPCGAHGRPALSQACSRARPSASIWKNCTAVSVKAARDGSSMRLSSLSAA